MIGQGTGGKVVRVGEFNGRGGDQVRYIHHTGHTVHVPDTAFTPPKVPYTYCTVVGT